MTPIDGAGRNDTSHSLPRIAIRVQQAQARIRILIALNPRCL